MIYLILSIFAIFIILVINEFIWRKRKIHGEFSRKFVHLTVGSFVAFWPRYLSWTQIKLIGLIFLVSVIISKKVKIFQAIHSVQRPTYGEAFFALAIIIVPFISQNKWVFTAAILQMSLADGLAAIIGLRFGGKYSYIVLNHTKTLVGTLTFFIASLLILIGFVHYSGINLEFTTLLIISFISSLLENIAIFGLDNLIVPLFIATLISHH